jgi:hypothetical protein
VTRRPTQLLARLDALAREIAELRTEFARELGLDSDDDEIAQLAAADLQRATRRRGGR